MRKTRLIPFLALLLNVTAIAAVLTGCSSGEEEAAPASGGGSGGGGSTPQPPLPGQPPVGGASVLFQRTTANGNADIYLVKSDGSGLMPLASDPAKTDEFSRLVGSRVLFHKRAIGGFTERDIWGVNTNGSGASALVEGPNDDVVAGLVGDRLIYQEGTLPPNFPLQANLMSIGLSGGTKVPLATTPQDERFFSAVGGRVIYEVNPAAQGDIYGVNADGSGGPPVPIANEDNKEEFPVATVGSQVIYQRRDAPGLEADLLVKNADGIGVASVLGQTPNSEFFAAVAGTRVIFYRCVPQGQPNDPCSLHSINADGSDEKLLATNGSTEFVWVVGDRIVHTRLNGGQKDLHSVLADGSDPKSLATDPLWNEFVSGVSGNRVIFRRLIGVQNDLYGINADGTGLATLADDALDETFGGIIGSAVIFERWITQSNADLFSVPINGNATPTLLATGPASQEYAGPAGDRVIYEQCSGGCVFGGPADIFSIPIGGGAQPTPLGPTSDDETFIASF